MHPFDHALSFIDHCERSSRIADLQRAFQRILETLGFRFFACASHVDPLHPNQEIMVLNYPRSWVECYSEQQLHLIDPVFWRADCTRSPFYWDDPAFRASMSPKQRKMQALARDFGVAHGYTIPIHSPMSTASCSVIPDSPRICRASYHAVELMAIHLFDRVARLQRPEDILDRVPHLSPRERQCLLLAAQGKSDAEVGMLLGIQKCSAHNCIERAKRRLALCTRMQAVVYAFGTRQIRLEDVLRPLHRVVRQRHS